MRCERKMIYDQTNIVRSPIMNNIREYRDYMFSGYIRASVGLNQIKNQRARAKRWQHFHGCAMRRGVHVVAAAWIYIYEYSSFNYWKVCKVASHKGFWKIGIHMFSVIEFVLKPQNNDIRWLTVILLHISFVPMRSQYITCFMCDELITKCRWLMCACNAIPTVHRITASAMFPMKLSNLLNSLTTFIMVKCK